MVTNHRLSFDVQCPACGATDTIIVTEDAGPPFTDEPRRTYSASEFGIKSGNPATIACATCGANFPLAANLGVAGAR